MMAVGSVNCSLLFTAAVLSCSLVEARPGSHSGPSGHQSYDPLPPAVGDTANDQLATPPDDGGAVLVSAEEPTAVMGHEEDPPSTNQSDSDKETGSDHSDERYHVAAVDFAYVATPFIISAWVMFASAAKIGEI